MANLAAVVGVGQTKHKSKHKDVSMAGLVRQAAERALAEAKMSTSMSKRCAMTSTRWCSARRRICSRA